MRANTIDLLCNDNDGGNSWYGITIRRGWYRLTFSNIFDSIVRLFYYSSDIASQGILLYSTDIHLRAVDSVDVSSADSLFDHQSQCCHLGYS